MKIIFIILGTISLIVGIIGIVVPGLPTTPFVLLAAGLYLKGSRRLHTLLITNKYLRHFLTDFEEKKGVSKNTKIFAITMMWTMLLISIIFVLNSIYLKLIIALLGIVGSYIVIWKLNTIKPN